MRGPSTRRPARVGRRRFTRGLALAFFAGVGGCTRPGGDGRSTTRDPAQVTTTGGEDVEVLVAQMVVRDGEDGPRAYYRLANRGAEDATVSVRTALAIEGGGTYEASVLVDVPAGDEVTVEYRVVRFEQLTDAEARAVRSGAADFTVFVNGSRRPV